MNTIKNVFELTGQRDTLNELRLDERMRLRVVRKRKAIHALKDEHYMYLEIIELGHENNIIALANAIGKLDRQIRDILDNMELSVNRQEGAGNED